jgi:hypothetical protein
MTPAKKTYSLAMVKKNKKQTAFILFHKSGIDIQIHDSRNYEVKKGDTWAISTNEGWAVRNYYARTETNLFRWIESFATDFDNNKKNLDKYFIPQGCKDSRRRDSDYIPPGDLLLRLIDKTSDYDQKDENYPIKDIFDGKVSLGGGLYIDTTGIGDVDKKGDFLD